MEMESTVVALDGKSWEKDLPELGDLEVLVGAWENDAFDRALQKKLRALPPALRADGIYDPASYYRCVGEAMAHAILFGWKNFHLGGADLPFDKATGLKYLTDRKYKVFRDGVVAAARRVQQGIKQEDETLEGNSSASSPGSASGEAIPTT